MTIIKSKLYPEGVASPEKRMYIFWYFVWGYGFFGELLNAASVRIPFLGSTSHVAPITVTIILLLGALRYLSKVVRLSDYIFWLIFAFAFLLSISSNTQILEVQEEYLSRCLLYSVPYLFLGLAVDIQSMRKPMSRISVAVILWYVFYCMYYQQTKIGSMLDNEMHENMHFAYIVLPHVLMCLWSSFKDRDYISIAGAFVGIFLLLSLGNRGSLVDLAVFIVIYVLFFLEYKRKWLVYISCVLIAGIFYLSLDAIIIFFQVQLADLGMSTRIVDVLAENSFFTGNSVDERDLYIINLSEAVKNAPFFGYGVCGSWQFIGSYPHNLFYDLAITFGLVPGSLLLVAFVYMVLKGYLASSASEEKEFLLMLVTVGFVKLFISYTFLDNFETYLLIGYCLNLIRKSKYMES